jgi:hypothetical protein
MYHYIKTATSITIWTPKKTFLIGVDDPKYNDVVSAVEKDERLGICDWGEVAALLDPDIFELDDDDDDTELD